MASALVEKKVGSTASADHLLQMAAMPLRPFCSHTKPVVAITTLALGIAPEQHCMAMSYLVLAALAMYHSNFKVGR